MKNTLDKITLGRVSRAVLMQEQAKALRASIRCGSLHIRADDETSTADLLSTAQVAVAALALHLDKEAKSLLDYLKSETKATDR